MILDIDQSKDKTTEPDLSSIADFVRSCNVPLTYGGGIGHVDTAVDVIQAGADKILINSHQYTNRGLISELATKLGSQAVVVGIDVKRNSSGKTIVFSHCGTINKNRARAAAKIAEQEGAGEIVITSIDRDGTMEGYDLDPIREITDMVKTHDRFGGAKNADCFVKAVQQANASAVAAGAVFHFTELTPDDARLTMSDAGIPVRQVLHDA